ncbi:hypothetical protein Kpho02_69870 [Kitasatospora phosalacinea]|uniref:SMODS and SLOG-associating 2TM effector domain-containing protein n=1 Tax=Kitasatospora phosalacinea TaxID=2065 RepID=A0A9W6V6Z6_9ACTN|nr:hypothetical protein [Kitasatospora phosalacinea]GLW74690.1 hypothetical protein Kpho02_69870 [Kitasatospora phosalacinea]
MGSYIPRFVDNASKAKTLSEQKDLIAEVQSEALGEHERWERKQVNWRRAHFTFGIPAAVFSAIAGLTALSSTAGRIPAAILAILGAICAAISTFLNAEKQRSRAEQRAAAWKVLEMEARLALVEPDKDLRKRLLNLRDLYWAIRGESEEEVFKAMTKARG